MLTRKEYEKLWNDNVARFTKEKMPSYEDYVIRENMIEDYLDIFRGESTREKRSVTKGIKWYYDHPFFNTNGTPKLAKKPCIKYIMIAEAAPKPNPFIPTTKGCLISGGDDNNTYFYNILHLKATNYLSSPRIAFASPPYRSCPENKINTLLDLASKGFLLLDLFPFSISYSTSLRTSLNNSGVTRYFWDNLLNPFSMLKKINSISGLLCNEWDISMIAPNEISEFIVNPINTFPPLPVVPIGIHPTTFRDKIPNPTRATDWRKITVTTAGAPSSDLVRISFKRIFNLDKIRKII